MIVYEDQYIKIEDIDNVIICSYQPNTIIDRNISDVMIKERIKASKEKDRLVVMDGRNVKYWTLSSRNSSMKDLGFKYISKSSLILSSKILLTLWKMGLHFYSPPVEIQVFTNFKEGVKWLKS